MTHTTGQFSFLRSNQRGATLIEYVLMLVVVVALVKLLSTACDQPMNKFLNAYMGTYIQCLLEFGELPSLGGESTTDGECNARFQPATLADGRPPKSDSEQAARKSDPSQKDKGSDDEIRQANRSGGTGGGSNAGSSRRQRDNNSSLDRTPAPSKTVVIDLNEDPNGKFFTPSSTGPNAQATSTAGSKVSRYFLTESEAQELDQNQRRRSAAKVSEVTPLKQKNKKFKVEDPPKRKVASAEEDGFSFGNIIRWIVIGILILFVLIFLVGLMSQFSRANRKSS
jgi:hypothetical protein